MNNLYQMNNYRKGVGSMVCDNCGSDETPIEKTKTSLVCSGCSHPFSYFQNSAYFNKKKEQRLKDERDKDNKSLKRSLRL